MITNAVSRKRSINETTKRDHKWDYRGNSLHW